MKKELLLLLFLFTLLVGAKAADAYQFYVAVEGSDAASGTSPDQAFATVGKAQQAIRQLKRGGRLNKPVTVYLRGGQYTIREPFVFTPEDSGTETAPITYTAYQQEQVVISGGKVIKGWKPYKKGIWMARLPEVKQGKWKFRQLYVNGEKRQRARNPNQGFLRVKGFPDGSYPDVHYHTDCQRFEYAPGDIDPRWTNLEDVEVIVYHFWTDSHLPIQSIDAKNRIVTFKHKAGKVFNDDFSNAGARYVVENVWEALDAPGEWYLNKKTGMLYYYPQPGENMSQVEVVAPVAPAFVRLEGQAEARQLVTHLNFKGLTFQYNNWDLPAGNSNDDQGSASVPASITLSGAQYNTFENCTILNTGTFAFDIIGGAQYNNIRFCNLRNLGAGGIRINGGRESDHPLLHTAHNVVQDNTLLHYGQEFPSAVGVMIMHAGHNQVVHNEIAHGFYTGISVGMVWGYKRSMATHNLVAYNHIHDIGLAGLLSDMGGIYTLGVSSGTVLRNNVIHDVSANHYGGWGIYLDEGSAHILVEDNIVYNTKFAPFNIHYSKEVLARNNIFAFGKLEQLSRQRVEPHKSVYFENNIVYWKEGPLLVKDWKDKPYPFHTGANQNAQELQSTFDMDYNLYYNPAVKADALQFNGLSWADWQKTGKDTHSRFADPLFENPEQYDFRLKPGSPALELGFKPINREAVGPRKQDVLLKGGAGLDESPEKQKK
jgi:hypothetical protein